MRIVTTAFLVFFQSTLLADVAFDTQIQDPYARAAIKQQRNSAVFMRLENRDHLSASIVSASSPVANVVELHTHINDNGVMRMRPIPRIELPPGEAVELKPGGLHIMLLGLREDLVVGQQIALSLQYNDGSEKTLSVPVRRVMPPKGMHGNMHPMMKH